MLTSPVNQPAVDVFPHAPVDGLHDDEPFPRVCVHDLSPLLQSAACTVTVRQLSLFNGTEAFLNTQKIPAHLLQFNNYSRSGSWQYHLLIYQVFKKIIVVEICTFIKCKRNDSSKTVKIKEKLITVNTSM